MAQTVAMRARLTEGLVVVLSILLAFAIDAAWDSRQERKFESTMVSAVVAEVRANQEGLRRALTDAEERLARIDRFLELTPATLGDLRPEDVPELVQLSGSGNHLPIVTAATAFLATPASDSMGLAIRDEVGRWMQGMEGYENERLELKLKQDQLQHVLETYAARYTEGGVGPIDMMLGRSRDPELVSALRGDDPVVQAVIGLGARQWFYRFLVEARLSASEALLATLEDY